MKFVLASHNPGKLREMAEILGGFGIEAVTPDALGLSAEVEESGESFAENARLKARALCAAAGLPAIGDDSGLCVDALGGAPGIYSARYGGGELDDAGRCALLLQSLRGQTDRRARFVCAVACAFPNGDLLEAQGEAAGTVAFAPMGAGGFGYDPIFFLPERSKTMAQLTPEEKAAVSHRGRALGDFSQKLATYLRR